MRRNSETLEKSVSEGVNHMNSIKNEIMCLQDKYG